MRRLPLLILLVLLLTLALVGVAYDQTRPRLYAPHGPGEIYLALGDSLAWGARLENPDKESYPALIQSRLGASAPIELANLAVPGETSRSFLSRQLPQAIKLIEQARRDGQLVSPITVDIGGNDLRNVERAGPSERAAAVESVRANLSRILDELRRAAGPEADIAVMTYYNPYGGDPAAENSEAYWVRRLNTAISEEAVRRGAAVADTYTPFDGGRAYTDTFILLGDIHANALGHQLIADAFIQALRY